MTRRELAVWLCENVRRRRLERIGEPADEPGASQLAGHPFDRLPEFEQRNWLDMADAVLEFNSEGDTISRLQSLGADWLHYSLTVADAEERRSWQRCVVIEMRCEIDKLAKECEL